MWVQVPSSAPYADMAELADALDSGSSDFTVIQVQVLLSAPAKNPVKLYFTGFLLCVLATGLPDLFHSKKGL